MFKQCITLPSLIMSGLINIGKEQFKQEYIGKRVSSKTYEYLKTHPLFKGDVNKD